MTTLMKRLVPVVAGLALPLATAATARAANCSTLSKPVYVAGSSAVKPFLAKVATELAGLGTPITVVYQGQGSCTGVNYLSTTPSGNITGTGSIWDTAGTEGNCTLDLSGNVVDIGVSDVYAASCTATPLPGDVKDYFGPVQSMDFAVPKSSSESSISAEAAYLVFGLGQAGAAAPWVDETLIEQRNSSSGTQQMIAAGIMVPAAKFKGTNNAKSSDVLNSLVAAATGGNQDKAIGILSSDVIDANRNTVKSLAYQHFGQDCGYHPDSDVNSFDKQNVRDGHYMIWGPLHMLTHTSGGNPLSADAKTILDYLSGAVDPTGFDMIAVEAKGGVVPDCAMRVSRTSEVGPLASYMPPRSCECKFVKEATGTAASTCTTCTGDGDCSGSTPKCNYGYCEVQ